ncbi:hypothetical protein BDV12DRAFT_204113 [Aspergillus spectabilis]
MPAQNKSRRRQVVYADLTRLYDLSHTIASPLVSLDQLSQWGIRATQVDLDQPNFILHFSPSFFEPAASSRFDYPIIDPDAIRPYEETNHPGKGFDDFYSDYDDIMGTARTVMDYVTTSSDCLTRRHMVLINGPSLNKNGFWESEADYEDFTHESPHMVIPLLSDTVATNEALTVGEVQVSIWVSRFRYRDRLFVKHDIIPILIISYVGPKHGRVVQVHHDGNQLIMQFSPLVSFQDEETAHASMMLFSLYQWGYPEGRTERSTMEDNSSASCPTTGLHRLEV